MAVCLRGIGAASPGSNRIETEQEQHMDQETIKQAMEQMLPLVTRYGLQVLGAIVILVVGKFAAGLASRIVRKGMRKASADPALTSFLSSGVNIAVMAFAIIAALAKFGIQTTSFIAVLGAAGFAVGLALQGSLGNFAAGVMILIFRPIRVGDLVETGGYLGVIAEVGIFVTTMNTLDNKKIIIPNGVITGNVINNVNGNGTRRVDMTAGISYGDDMSKAKGILEEILTSHPKVLQEPAPTVAVSELGDSSVNFVVRPWVEAEDYWTVWFDVTQSIKERFDAQDVSIPFPQRDVHFYQESPGQVA
jgi:small conductance mechanosensitive channel